MVHPVGLLLQSLWDADVCVCVCSQSIYCIFSLVSLALYKINKILCCVVKLKLGAVEYKGGM